MKEIGEAKDGIDEFFDDDELTEQVPVEEVHSESKRKTKKFISYRQTLREHSLEVRDKAELILKEIDLPELMAFSDKISSAAHHHDLGKAHPIFQATLQQIDKRTPLEPQSFGEILAKSKANGKHRRSKFRHELASALAMLERNNSLSDEKKYDDLVIYLAAAHHGKVRLSIRALPDELKPRDDDGNFQPERKYARGIWENDELFEVDLGGDESFPAQTLSLNTLLLGRSDDGKVSWLERMLKLREKYGVFRLAYLEAIVRAADVQASKEAAERYDEAMKKEQNPLETNEND